MTKQKPLTNDAAIKRLKTPTTGQPLKRALHSPTGSGLRVFVHKTGARSFVGRYRIEGKGLDVVLGQFPAMTLAQAQARHQEGTAIAAQGKDPRNVWAAEYQANVKAQTAGDYFPDWLAFYKRSKNRQGRLPAANTLRDVGVVWAGLEWLHKMPLAEITKPMLVRQLKKKSASAPVQTRKALNLIRQVLEAATDDGLIPDNPAAGIKLAKVGGSTGAVKDRCLSPDEIKSVWAHIEGDHSLMADALRLLLITGARRVEVCHMAWAEVDLASGVWVLPAERAKNRTAYTFHLGPLALSILERLHGNRLGPFVFAGLNDGQPIHPDSLSRWLERCQPIASVERFTPHDIRRTATTGWRDQCGADPFTADAMGNHLPQGVMRHYQIGQALERHKAVRMKWEAFLLALIEGGERAGNVVSIGGGKA